MFNPTQTKAADDLEELTVAAKEVVLLLRQGQGEQHAYALMYDLRRRLGLIVRNLGTGTPSTAATHWASDILEEQIIHTAGGST